MELPAMSSAAPGGADRRRRLAILQSNYIPWKGYFDLIAAVDEFVLYDDVQFTKNDWRNRNRIKTPQGVQWLSVPVGQKIDRLVREVRLPDPRWQGAHWRTLELNYRRAPRFGEIACWLAPLYLERHYKTLSELNWTFIQAICRFLDIRTKISDSTAFVLAEGRTQRLADICLQADAAEYVSGPAAQSYLDEALLAKRGVRVSWFDYAGYPQYSQLWGEFVHEVSIVDLLFNCGIQSRQYMKSRAADTRGRSS